MFKTLQLSDLLRYAFSGGIFLAALFGAKDGISSLTITNIKTLGEATGAVAAAVIVGSLCYSVHRSFYRVIIRIQLRSLKKRLDRLASSQERDFLEKEFDRDTSRWARACNYPVFQERMAMWAAHIHFLYCSAWALFAGAVVGRMLLLSQNRPAFVSASYPRMETVWQIFVSDIEHKAASFFSRPTNLTTFYAILASAAALFAVALMQDAVLTYYDCKLHSDGVPLELRPYQSDSTKPGAGSDPGEY